MITKMSELNRELILDELSNFEQKNSGDIPVILNKYLESIAQNGDTMFSWIKLRPLLKRKLELVINEFNELCPTDHLIPLPNVRPFDFKILKQEILMAIDTFCSAPFTIQRICELLINPSKHYKRTDKFMRGIEKNILVVTTIEPKSGDGSSTQYTTSSFKNLFSSMHSTSSSLTSPSTSLMNGITDIMCDQQMAVHCSNDSDLHHLSSPVSPNSLPLSTHSTNSPPNSHLAPLQQLDSFTTVFASAPSTPLSVVSDLHTYEHSSNVSVMTSSTSGELLISNTSSVTKITETTTYLETNPSQQTDKISSNKTNDNSIKANDSIDMFSETEVDSNQIQSDSKKMDSNKNTTDSDHVKEEEETPQKVTNDPITEVSDKSIDKMVTTEDTEPNPKLNQTLSETSVPITDNNNAEIDESPKTDDKSDERLANDSLVSTESQPSVIAPVGSDAGLSIESVVESKDESLNEKVIEITTKNETRITNDEDMSQPMDDFNGNNTENTDMADCSERTVDSSVVAMDHTLSQSDQSEPMDED